MDLSRQFESFFKFFFSKASTGRKPDARAFSVFLRSVCILLGTHTYIGLVMCYLCRRSNRNNRYRIGIHVNVNLHRAIQSSIDLASHIVADEVLDLPQELRENFDLLNKHKILSFTSVSANRFHCFCELIKIIQPFKHAI